MEKEIAQILLEEWENKRSFEASWESNCDNCEDPINKGDSFVFYGSKKKLCNKCQGEVTEQLEETIENAL